MSVLSRLIPAAQQPANAPVAAAPTSRKRHRRTTRRLTRPVWNGSRLYRSNGERECARRVRQNARRQQLESHRDVTYWPHGTMVTLRVVKPFHIFWAGIR